MKVNDALNVARKKLIENEIEDSSIIARVLLQYVLKFDRNKLVLFKDEKIDENSVSKYEILVNKIIDGIPLQYITKKQEFYGLNFYVDENVLIPQPDTEILVEKVLQIANYENKTRILDMCTGSGCIGISLAKNIDNAKVTLSDISSKSLEIARKNAKNNNVTDKIEIIKSNMFEDINDLYDIIVSNPPYIETNNIKKLSKQVQNEPKIALDGGKDGLDFYRILINTALMYLNNDGYLCMEIGYNQKDKILEIIKESNIYSKYDIYKDLSRKR